MKRYKYYNSGLNIGVIDNELQAAGLEGSDVWNKCQEWIDEGNTPEPWKTQAELDEMAAIEAAEIARKAAKAQAYIDNLPDWATVKKAIDAAFIDAKQNGIITKLARVVYWDVKDTEL
jgi:hypothetical protein